jgi:acetyl-CoA carboxylase biotin carboxyl carrier protein
LTILLGQQVPPSSIRDYGGQCVNGKGNAMAQWDEQFSKLKQIIEMMKDHNLVEIQIKQGEEELCVKKAQPVQPQFTAVPMFGAGMPGMLPGAVAPAAGQGQEAAPQEAKPAEIKSPLVGTFYAQPSPDSEPFVELGSRVEPETVVCIIEAMKVMNEIKAEMSGVIVDVVTASGSAVEYGQVLFKVRPD